MLNLVGYVCRENKVSLIDLYDDCKIFVLYNFPIADIYAWIKFGVADGFRFGECFRKSFSVGAYVRVKFVDVTFPLVRQFNISER